MILEADQRAKNRQRFKYLESTTTKTTIYVCQQATSIQSVKYGNTYAGKSFCWHTGGGGGKIFKKKSDSYIS